MRSAEKPSISVIPTEFSSPDRADQGGTGWILS